MQLAESLLILYVTGNLFYLLFGKKPGVRLAYAGLAIIMLHLLLGEARWQVVPVYAVMTILLAVHFLKLKTRKWLRVFGCSLGFLLAVASTALCYALPVFSLYQPTGDYAVAYHQQYLKDKTRLEDITETPEDIRELMIDIYYPIENSKGPTTPYLKPIERTGFAKKYGLPDFAFSYLKKVDTYVQMEAPAPDPKYPVLIFSPGYYTPATGYQSIVADLVSHGFIVFSINHTFETVGSRFPDGREVFFDQAFANANSWSDAMGKAVAGFENASTEEEKYEAIKSMNEVYDGGAPMVKRWAADVSSVIDAMEIWNNDPDFPLAGKMKLDQLGALGHSRGGASAIEASIFDDRIKVAANLDGAQWGTVIRSKLNKPTLLFSSSTTIWYDVNKYIFQKAKGHDFYDVVLANSGHSNFSDIPYMIRIPQLNEAGEISPKAATQSFNNFLVAFFQKHLLGQATNLEGWVASDENLSWKE